MVNDGHFGRSFVLLTGLVLIMASFVVSADRLSSLKPFLWDNRLILINAGSDPIEMLEAKLREVEFEINDRHIIWFIFSESAVVSNYQGEISDTLREAVAHRWSGARPAGQQVVLVGKDGGSKMRLNTLDLASIFITIDGMPMRQNEMRQSAAIKQEKFDE